MNAFQQTFPLYWRRLYPPTVALGIVSAAYLAFCPKHLAWMDFVAGMLAALAALGWLFTRKTT